MPHGLYSYGLYSYGLYSYGLYSYGRCPMGYGRQTRVTQRPACSTNVRETAQNDRKQGMHPAEEGENRGESDTATDRLTVHRLLEELQIGQVPRGVMAYIVMAYIVMAYIVIAFIVMAYIVMAHVVMAYIVMAYMVMAYKVMAVPRGVCRCGHHRLAPLPGTATRRGSRRGGDHGDRASWWIGDEGTYCLYSYGLCSYGLYSYGLCSYGFAVDRRRRCGEGLLRRDAAQRVIAAVAMMHMDRGPRGRNILEARRQSLQGAGRESVPEGQRAVHTRCFRRCLYGLCPVACGQ